jgi:hypothetical protein
MSATVPGVLKLIVYVLDSGQSITATGVFGMDVRMQYLGVRSVEAGHSATLPGFPECLGWSVSYSAWISKVFGLDCQLQYLDS